LDRLAGYLRAHHETDVLMPLRSETKVPKYGHKDGSWSWCKYEEHRVREPEHRSYGILLRSLCAVDIDSESLAEDMETRYPEMRRAPMERTRKGRHYVFVRPEWADEESYYDGSRQHGQTLEVDFKSVCSTGTSGLLVVCPSSSKEWVRPPWEHEPFPISRSLLEAVAKARGTVDKGPRSVERFQESRVKGVTKLLNILSKTRWDDRAQWMIIATALKNEGGDRYKDQFKTLSRVSAKYDEAEAEKLWWTVARQTYEGPRVTLRTLEKWASEDDAWAYAEYRASELPGYVLENWEKEDRGLAIIAARMLKEEVKVTTAKAKTRTVYYFDAEECRWYESGPEGLHRLITAALEATLRDVATHYERLARPERDEALRSRYEERRVQAGKVLKYVYKHTGISNVTQEMLPYCVDPTFEAKLDATAHLLGVKNGVVDLRTGQLRARVPEDMILNVADVTYDPDADSTCWTTALRRAMCDDEEMVSFLQLLLGYGITGLTAEEIFVILTGTGRNFKGVTTQTLERIMGQFFASMNSGLICERSMSNVDAERGKLLGKRIIVFNELKPGEKLKTDEVKLLSGGDGIPARPLYKDPLTIIPRHLSILSTNHMPELNGDISPAMMERLLVIHFPVTFTDLREDEAETPYRKRADKMLKKVLMEESSLSGVLTWLVQGSIRWYADPGCIRKQAPAKVTEFGRAYFEEQDRLASFIQVSCDVGPECKIPTSEFVMAYNADQDKSGEVKQSTMSKAMKAKGFMNKVSRYPGYPNPVHCFMGLTLKSRSAAADVGVA
jgi:P4 family phage/plasmid primase-like protien